MDGSNEMHILPESGRFNDLWHGIYGSSYLLHDAGLRDAIFHGRIRISPTPEQSQFQPATLDVKVGMVRVFEPLSHPPFVRKIAKTYHGEKDEPIIVPSKCDAFISLNEKIEIENDNDGNAKYLLSFEPRSSRGRLHLMSFKQIYKENGRCVLHFLNESQNDILIYGQAPFAQLFFHPRTDQVRNNGFIVDDPIFAKRLAEQVLEGHYMMEGAAVKFAAQDTALKLKNIGTIDTRRVYTESELYEIVDLRDTEKNDSLIVKLLPKVQLPDNIGIRLLHRRAHNPNSGQMDPAVRAGWVDPGYRGVLTAHPKGGYSNHTDALALGMFYYYTTSVDRAYGSALLTSHYQGSQGTGAKS